MADSRCGDTALLTLPAPKYKSKMEAAYARHLDLRQKAGEVIRWAYEPVRFRLADGSFYCPDFRLLVPLIHAGGPVVVEFHETKGHWREAAKVRFKVAASLFPEYRWRVVTGSERKGWTVQTPEEAFRRKGQ